MNLFVRPIFLLWSKGLFNITEKNYITVLGNEKRKVERLKGMCWMTMKHSKNCEYEPYHERSEGSLYPLFVNQSTSPSSSAPLIGKFPEVSQIDNFNLLLNMKVSSLVNIWHNMANYCSINFFYKSKISCVREVQKLERKFF